MGYQSRGQGTPVSLHQVSYQELANKNNIMMVLWYTEDMEVGKFFSHFYFWLFGS